MSGIHITSLFKITYAFHIHTVASVVLLRWFGRIHHSHQCEHCSQFSILCSDSYSFNVDGLGKTLIATESGSVPDRTLNKDSTSFLVLAAGIPVQLKL